MKAPFRRSALYASLFALAAPVAMAQVVLEEMIVTAQKREEGLQDVPISVNAVSGVKMEQVGITNLEKLTAYVPNFSMNQTGISSTITIRGISSGINQSFEQSVGMYNDGVYFGKAQLARLPLFDMARVEVLRGPQPVLFGKNSIAGAVSLITQKPTNEFEGSLQALYEPDHDENDYRLVVNGPITDGLSMRASLLYREMDGWAENLNADGRTEKNEEETVARISALWEASENLSIHAKYENAQFDTWGRNIEIVGNLIREDCVEPKQPSCTSAAPISYLDAVQSRVALLNTLIDAGARSGPKIEGLVYDDGKLNDKRYSGAFDTSQNNVDNWMLNADYLIGEHTLTFVSGYVDYKSDESCDCDYSPAPIIDNSILSEEFSQFSQEIRLTSPGGETIDYIAGLFYQDSELDLADKINVPPDTLLRLLANALAGTSTNRQFEQDTEVWAAFAQATWSISDDWRLIVGGRYTEEEKEAYRRQTIFDATGTDVFNTSGLMNALYGALRVEAHQLEGSNSENAFTPVITGQWDFNDDTMLYLTYVEGFKSGGYDNRSNAHPPSDPAYVLPGQNPATAATIVGAWEFDKEEASSVEFGAKNTLADGAAELNVAVFYTEYDDLQTSVFDGGIGFNVTNAGKATTQGVEMDGRWALHEYFSVAGSLAYLDFEFDEFPVAQCYFGQIQLKPDTVTNAALQQCDAAGERKEYTPEWKGVISGDFMYPLMDGIEFRAGVDVQYSDSYLWTPQLDPRTEQDAYYKVNARLALKSDVDTWEVALIGNNLNDERVLDYGGTGVLAGTLTAGTGNGYYAFTNRPRSYAIQGTWRF